MTYTGTVTYSYDALGRVDMRTIDSANPVDTTFDALGRVTTVTNALTPTGSFTYGYLDETSLLTSVTAPASTGLSASYTYFTSADPQDWERLETIQNMSGTIQLSNFGYTYNPVGTISTWTTQTGTTTAILNTLSYDNADQLTKNIQSGGGTTGNQYNYDPAGNRLAGTTLNGTLALTTTAGLFNNLNQLISTGTGTTTTVSGTTNIGASILTVNGTMASISGTVNFTTPVPTLTGTNVNVLSIMATPTNGAPTATQRFGFTLTGTTPILLSYDLNGNTTTDENGYTYTWDALNRLKKITYPNSSYTTMAYDGLSRRTQIEEYTSTGSLTSAKNYLWVGSEMAEERDASNNVTKRFFPQGEQQSGTNYYETFDHLRSTREMCSSTGTIVSRLSYNPNGVTTVVSGTTLPTLEFAGMYWHAPSQSYQTLYRIYRPGMALWDTRDPMGEGAGNLYGYCDNDPVSGVDQLGLYSGKGGYFPTNYHPLPGAPVWEARDDGGDGDGLDGNGLLSGAGVAIGDAAIDAYYKIAMAAAMADGMPSDVIAEEIAYSKIYDEEGACAATAFINKHHLVPQASAKQLPPALRNDPEIKNALIDLDPLLHRMIHDSPPGKYYPGGLYNGVFDHLVEKNGGYENMTKPKVLAIIEQMKRIFKLPK